MPEGYIKPGEFLFVSPKYPMLAVQVGGHGYMSNGRPERPKFAHFHPGPFGGEFRTKDKAMAELLRERDRHDDHYQEVASDEQLRELSVLRDKIVEDIGDRVIRGLPKKGKLAPSEPAPESREHDAPSAAKGPGKKF